MTVTHIAERAGITRRTYFRYFPDKREVLFANSDRLVEAAGDAVLAAGAQVSALDAALSAFTLAGNYLTAHIAHAAERLEVIRASPDLQERERTKHAALSTEIERALVTRGTASGAAHVIAQVATLAFVNAYEQRAEARDHEDFAERLRSAVIAIRSALEINTYRPRRSTAKGLAQLKTTVVDAEHPAELAQLSGSGSEVCAERDEGLRSPRLGSHS